MIPVSRLFSVQDESNSLSTYTLKGIEFLEKIGNFVKERAIIEEEYSTKLRHLARKYARKEDEEEILKMKSVSQCFNGILHQLEVMSNIRSDVSEKMKTDLQSFINSKSVQHRSSRKHNIGDLATIDEKLNDAINDLFLSRKTYLRAFKDAENSFAKFTKADKNLEISRLELEKIRNHLNSRNTSCEEAKDSYRNAVDYANQCQTNYYEKLQPMVFEKFKAVDKECVADMKEVFQRLNDIEKQLYLDLGECGRNVQICINHVNPDHDASLVLERVESSIIRPEVFVFEDLGDPNDLENRSSELTDGKRVDQVLQYLQKRTHFGEDSPGKKSSIRQLFVRKEKKENTANSDDEDYSDLPPKVRLRCLKSKIGKLEKRLEKTVQAREGLNKLQNAYRENPKLGNPSECNEYLYQHAKQIEMFSVRIEKWKNLMNIVEEAISESEEITELSFVGRDTTPDTTRSISGYSTNLSSKTNTLEEPFSSLIESCCTGVQGGFSFGAENSTPLSHLETASPLRKREISSPILRKSSTSSPLREIPPSLGTAIALFGFEGTMYDTISLKEGEKLFLMERDNGDGWTKVRRISIPEEGFVPTTYLRCSWNL